MNRRDFLTLGALGTATAAATVLVESGKTVTNAVTTATTIAQTGRLLATATKLPTTKAPSSTPQAAAINRSNYAQYAEPTDVPTKPATATKAPEKNIYAATTPSELIDLDRPYVCQFDKSQYEGIMNEVHPFYTCSLATLTQILNWRGEQATIASVYNKLVQSGVIPAMNKTIIGGNEIVNAYRQFGMNLAVAGNYLTSELPESINGISRNSIMAGAINSADAVGVPIVYNKQYSTSIYHTGSLTGYDEATGFYSYINPVTGYNESYDAFNGNTRLAMLLSAS